VFLEYFNGHSHVLVWVLSTQKTAWASALAGKNGSMLSRSPLKSPQAPMR